MGRWSPGLSHNLPTPSSSGGDSVHGSRHKSTAGTSRGSCRDRARGADDNELDDLLPSQPFDVRAASDTRTPGSALRIPYRMLNTGARCPGIGYGTGGEGSASPTEIYKAVRVALDRGYRSFDVAPFYQDGMIEQVVGRAVRESGVPRNEIFVTTKIWPTFSRIPEASLNMSLKNLDMEYVDCLLLHWPIPLKPVVGEPYAMGAEWDAGWDFKKTWAKMQEIPRTKARAIGVCNFTVNRLRLLMGSPTTKVVPAVLQVEGHPELPQQRLMQYCRRHSIQVFCFSPLAQGQVSNPTIQHVAQHYDVDSAQVALSWAIQRGTVPLPKSTNPTRVCTNMSLVHLNAEALDLIDQLGKHPRRIVNPRLLFGHDIFDDNRDSVLLDAEEPDNDAVRTAESDEDAQHSNSSGPTLSEPPHKRRRT